MIIEIKSLIFLHCNANVKTIHILYPRSCRILYNRLHRIIQCDTYDTLPSVPSVSFHSLHPWMLLHLRIHIISFIFCTESFCIPNFEIWTVHLFFWHIYYIHTYIVQTNTLNYNEIREHSQFSLLFRNISLFPSKISVCLYTRHVHDNAHMCCLSVKNWQQKCLSVK